MFCDVTGELLYLWHQSYRNSPKTLTLHSPNSPLKRTRSPHVLTQAPHQILKSPPCSQHLWETLPPRNDLSKLDTPNNKPHLLYFLHNALQFRWSFLLFSLFYFQPVLRPVQDYKNANSQGFPVRIHLHGWNVSQLRRCQRKKHGYKSERFLLHMVNHLFFIVRTTTNHHSNSILVHFVGWLFLALQTLANQWLPNYHKNIFSNILSLDSFFSQHRALDILWGRLRYILTP